MIFPLFNSSIIWINTCYFESLSHYHTRKCDIACWPNNSSRGRRSPPPTSIPSSSSYSQLSFKECRGKANYVGCCKTTHRNSKVPSDLISSIPFLFFLNPSSHRSYCSFWHAERISFLLKQITMKHLLQTI